MGVQMRFRIVHSEALNQWRVQWRFAWIPFWFWEKIWRGEYGPVHIPTFNTLQAAEDHLKTLAPEKAANDWTAV